VNISQAEARRLRRRVRQLEDHLSQLGKTWGTDYPGTCIGCEPEITPERYSAVETATRLGFAVVCRAGSNGAKLELYAVNPREVKA
jgi:RNA polymerase-binding transcription factor DksA